MKIAVAIAAKPSRCARPAAFTMIELALCIAIVSIAMVAIIGVLPLGLGVQTQNKEETIINQDATVLLEAIRNGAVNVDDLTNYVDFVTVSRQAYNSGDGKSGIVTNGFKGIWYTGVVPNPGHPLVTGGQIIGLLSLPKYDSLPGFPGYTNWVTAQFRAFSGNFNEKIYLTNYAERPNPSALERAFKYQVTAQVVPVGVAPLVITNGAPNSAQLAVANGEVLTMSQNLYDVNLTFRWPVFDQGGIVRVGGNIRTVRTQVASLLVASTDPTTGIHTNFPNTSISPRRFVPGLVSPYKQR